MDLRTLHAAIGTLLADNPERGSELVHLKVGEFFCEVSGITVVVESDDWVPDTIVMTVEEIEDS